MQKLDKILKEFLGNDELRPTMSKPQCEDGNVIATNAHILLVAPERYFENKYERQEKYVNYKAVIPNHDKENFLFELGADDFRKVYNDIPREPKFDNCHTCDGEGTIHCEHCDNEYDCKTCDGDGKSKIKIGTQINHRNHSIEIKDVHFNPDLLKIVFQVAKCIESPINVILLQEKKPNLFYISDIMILLMPLSEPGQNAHAMLIKEKV